MDLLSLQKVTQGGLTPTKTFDKNTYAIIRPTKALPFARLYADWETSDESNWMKNVAEKMGTGHDDTLVVSSADLPSPEKDATAGKVSIETVRFQDKAYMTRISTDAPTAQVLHLQQGFSPVTHAWIDGKETPIFKAGYFGIGLPVPAGKHQVIVGPVWHPGIFAFSTCIMLLFIAGCVSAIRTAPPALEAEPTDEA